MPLDPNSGSVITLAEAQRYVAAFRLKCPSETKGVFAGVNKLNLILDQHNCIGIRMYNGIDDQTGKMNLVLVGVNSDMKDMTDGVILEKLVPCPPHYCDPTSPLNL